MVTLSKTIRWLTVAGFLSLMLNTGVSHAATPAFYHYYYVYSNSMHWCGKLLEEVFENTNNNWQFTKKSIKKTAISFSKGNVRGVLRCLSKKSDESWVVIIATGNDGKKTKDLFEELRLGVCGECSAWAK